MTMEKEMEKVLKALANHRRLQILRVLKRGKDVTVGEMADIIHLSLKSTSRHLAVLAAAHIIEKEQISLEVYYELSPGMPRLAEQVISKL